jgi:hypothetical protein
MYANQQFQYHVEMRLQGLKVTDLLTLCVLGFVAVWLEYACLLLLSLGWQCGLRCVSDVLLVLVVRFAEVNNRNHGTK